MKIGDVIKRKDIPTIHFRILGESDQWKDMWNVELITPQNEALKIGLFPTGMVAKDDYRWGIVREAG